MTNIANWKITMFNGNIHYFDWAIFNSYVSLCLYLFFPRFSKQITTNSTLNDPTKPVLKCPTKPLEAHRKCRSWPSHLGWA